MVVGEFVEKRELIIIGGGPAGYHAAIRSAKLGIQVTLIEQAHLGGTCLNKGCIPSKVFSYTANKLASVEKLSTFGISVGDPFFHIDQLTSYKDKTIQQLRTGVEDLCQANAVEVIQGKANFINETRIGVESDHQFTIFEFEKAIIATGSSPVLPDSLKDYSCILTEEDIYMLEKIPEELVIYGNNYLALEAAFSFRTLGAGVTMVLNGSDDFYFDSSINRELKRILKRERIQVYRGYHLEQLTSKGKHISLEFHKNDQQTFLSATHFYIQTKHAPRIEGLGIERLAMDCTEDGFIRIDKKMRTNIPSIFAIGDVTGGKVSAVKAMKQGKVVAEIIAGLASEVDLTMVPTVVHSIPPIAAVGLTEEEAKQLGYQIKTSLFRYSGNGYAMIANEKSGIAKVIKDAKTDLLLGVHTIGASAIELISTGITALELASRDEDLKFPLYPHPSFNEILLEAVEGLTESAIHIKPKPVVHHK